MGSPRRPVWLIPQLQKIGVSDFGLEALYEKPHELLEKLLAYIRVLRGQASPDDALASLRAVEVCGVSEGQLVIYRRGSTKGESVGVALSTQLFS